MKRRNFIVQTSLVSFSGAALLVTGCGGGSTGGGGTNSRSPLLAQYKLEMRAITGQFKMGRTEVTVAMWKEYCAATGRSMPPAPDWGWIDSHPIVNVSWYDCNDYAIWAGLRLPTGAEWELAASGGDGRQFPWGGYAPYDGSWPGWDSSKCVNVVRGDRQPAPVGSIPAGNSPFGCADMAGNVWEWCSNDYSYGKEVRGASWDFYIPDYFLCAFRDWRIPDNRFNDFGFRLSAGPG